MKYLKLFLNERKGKTALTLLMLLGQVVGTLLVPFLIAGIVDEGILKGNMEAIIHIGMQMLAVTLLTALVSVLGSYFSADLAAIFGRDMRERVFRKSQELSIRQFDSIGVSSMITRTTSDISNLQQTLGLILQLIVPAPMIIAASIVMTWESSPPMAFVLVACVVLFLLIAGIVLKKSNRLSQQIQVRLDHINQVIRESITGIRVIRAFGNEAYEENRSGQAFEQYAGNMIRLNKLFAIQNPAIWLLMGLSMAVVVWLGGLFSMSGTMEIGKITAVIEYTIMALSYLIMATTISVTLPKMKACLDRLEEVLNIDLEIQDAAVKQDSSRENAPMIEFENVSFLYPGAEEPVIKDLSFRCQAGQTTAIIGSTGAGKSTIANLLLRLHDVNSGQICLQGVDIRTIAQEKLREFIGYVPQKAFLFSGTIADNLRMGRKSASEKNMNQALSISQADSFVGGLPLGLSAPVAQGGSNFSGGQKQRLSIARAIIKSAPVLIFDDSFSALDLKTDAALRKALKEKVTDAVKIIIAQRVSTIMDADQIIVLEEGQIAGMGTHRALMEHCAVYQDIAKSQMSIKEAETDEKEQ